MRHLGHCFSAAGAVLLIAASAAPARANTTFPPMRPGFWQGTMYIHINVSGQPPDTDNTPTITYNCQNAASMAAELKSLSGAVPGCTFDLEGGGSQYTVTTTCKNVGGQPGSLTGNGTFTMQGDTAMHVSETSSGTIAGMHMSGDINGDSKWIGDCPAGAAPGDYGKMVNGVFQKQGNFFAAPTAAGQ